MHPLPLDGLGELRSELANGSKGDEYGRQDRDGSRTFLHLVSTARAKQVSRPDVVAGAHNTTMSMDYQPLRSRISRDGDRTDHGSHGTRIARITT